MPTLHVRNVPEDIYQRLHVRAHQQNRSLSAEVIAILDHVLATEPAAQAELLGDIRRRRARYAPAVPAPDAVDLLREDRAR